MRPLPVAVAATAVLVVAAVGVRARGRFDPFAHGRRAPRGALVATPIDPDAITTSEPSLGVVAYRVPLPPAVGDGDSVELRFRDPLDGARVDAVGEGPRLRATLLRKRVGGDTVVVPLAPGRTDAVEVRVHRNLRPPPIVREAVVMTPAPPTAADPPPAAFRQSTR